MKRELILDAARRVFEKEGLEGASVRAIAAEAGYTPAALYFHFESKEAMYVDVLQASLTRLQHAMSEATAGARAPAQRLRRAALCFFDFYAAHPRDLDLGFYLFRGGMKPQGLGRERDAQLDRALEQALAPIVEAAESFGASADQARQIVVEVFAHAAGLLLLAHTGRLRLFGGSATERMAGYLDGLLATVNGRRGGERR